MNIFLSYPSVRRDLAERLKFALEAEGHEVFFDRDDLSKGEPFHRAIRDAVGESDLCIFLVTPESVAAGSYTLAELGFVQQRWPRPAARVLPVITVPTPRETIPAYLLAVTLFEPRGELVAETVAQVASIRRPALRNQRVMLAGAAGAIAIASMAGLGWRQIDKQRAADALTAASAAASAAAAERLTAEAQRALALCRSGSQAEGFDALKSLATTPGVAGVSDGAPAAPAAAIPAAVTVALQDCAMAWLRSARVTQGHSTFEQLVAPLKPVLAQALVAGASGAHAGDLQAHLGWADVLVRIDGRSVTPDPEASFRRALEADPGNVYGHAMWASWMLRRDTRRSVEAMGHFDAALASGRDTPFVRSLQLGMMVTSQELGIGALRVLNQMRVKGETLDPAHKPRIWSYLYAGAYRQADADRLTQAVPPQDALATFHWLFKRDDLDPSQHRLWRLVEGLLLSAAGKAEEARPILQALQQDLRASRSSGPIVERVEALLAKC